MPVEFEAAVRNFIKIFPKRVDEYEALLTNNPLFLDRVAVIGKLSAQDALSYGVTGPNLRASGVDWDLRKVRPYMGDQQVTQRTTTVPIKMGSHPGVDGVTNHPGNGHEAIREISRHDEFRDIDRRTSDKSLLHNGR